MIEILDKTKCCGCNACAQKCPKHCIHLIKNSEGFYYPQVDTQLCINCGLCEKVCPVINQNPPHQPKNVYAVKNKNTEIRLNSSSGGVFSLIAEKIIEEKGVVFGARYDDNWNVVMDFAETLEDVKAFRNSKYVQCFVGDSYLHVEKFLKAGRKVLYSGTPCMIRALKLFLKRDYDNLLTVDIVCHGVPSPGVWQDYLKSVKEIIKVKYPNKPKISSINFRDKTNGWSLFSFAFSITESIGEHNTFIERTTFYDNPFMRAFWRDLILRPSCYYCPVRDCKSGADLTIGDFWSISLVDKQFDDDKGVGVLLVHTDKGKSILPWNQIEYISASYELASKWNGGFNKTTFVHTNRKRFFDKYKKHPQQVIKLLIRNTDRSFLDKIRDKIKSLR